MTDDRPLILGYDAVSPLGTELQEQLEAAFAGRSGVGPLRRFPLPEGFPVTVAGEVPDFDASPYPFLSRRALARWSSPVFAHALLVTHRALGHAGLEITPALAPRVAITFSTAIGGLDAVLAADRRMQKTGKLPGPFVNPNSCINMVAGKLSIHTGATGPIATTITACATGSTSLIVGAMFLAAGMADVAICGAVDFPLVEPIVAGFATMNGAYRHRPDRDPVAPEAVSRPFSEHRRGFVVSEGAAALILVTPAFARAHGLTARHQLAGWGTTADAKHFVAPNRPTIARCMAEALAHAGLRPQDLDAINAHAASTKVGDATEVEALTDVFGAGAPLPPVMANKSQLGHCMGASSAVETVLALEAMRHGRTIPTLNHRPDPALGLDSLCTDSTALAQEHVLKNAFGFGGCNACLVLRSL
jgi:3-oxoacyl-[acyl-carrier-protein] synthase II